ncbi:hypothetical protein JCGZ_23360 [Jatropha curcas]|uniref:Uncharacterized GPI-anchored protein At5g19230-like domain-containing protein n=1 Tax=Jatropha curcas TaxID=180498 RepID=A0A067JI22_JATCU|nr:uncharacterized GPI-anchored protein At5g19250 [Jatropha curcas]KDP23527.1 hypothetical protein JCGZ_23360 [Jatropha curcas]
MASLKLRLILLGLLLAIFLLSSPVHCDDDEDDLFKCLNSHRAYLDLPTLVNNEDAECLAGEVAKELEDQPCNGSHPLQLDEHTDLLSKCDINISHAKEGVVLPVCVPDLVPTVVFTNYTRTHYAKYINDSKFAQAGVGSKGDWMVVVLGTNSTGGDFAAAACRLVSAAGFGHCLVCLLLGLLALWF